MGQLSRIVLAETSSSPDEQDATLDDGGSYGDLVDELDRLLARTQSAEGERSDA
jgi:hypothetical protein